MKRLAPFMGLMLLCLLAPWNAARADGTWANCVTKFQEPSTPYGYYQFIGGATTHLGRDVAIGEPFGPWLTSLAPAASTHPIHAENRIGAIRAPQYRLCPHGAAAT